MATFAGNYSIGTFANGPQGIQGVQQIGLPKPSGQQFVEFQDKLDGLDGRPFEVGFPQCTWEFPSLTQDQFLTLHNYVGDAASAQVYIATLINYGGGPQGPQGPQGWVYRVFLCNMFRPVAQAAPYKRRASTKITFSMLVGQ